jgi:hypothetical protein
LYCTVAHVQMFKIDLVWPRVCVVLSQMSGVTSRSAGSICRGLFVKNNSTVYWIGSVF